LQCHWDRSLGKGKLLDNIPISIQINTYNHEQTIEATLEDTGLSLDGDIKAVESSAPLHASQLWLFNE
jgi:hypothetical protein